MMEIFGNCFQWLRIHHLCPHPLTHNSCPVGQPPSSTHKLILGGGQTSQSIAPEKCQGTFAVTA